MAIRLRFTTPAGHGQTNIDCGSVHGGRSRKDGQTLRQQMDAAIRASPDVVGIISWNEFSENTHIEPSQNYGTRYLEVLADILGGAAPSATDFDSSEPAATGISYGLPLLGGLVALIAAGLVIVVRRGNRKGATPPAAIRQEGPGDTLS